MTKSEIATLSTMDKYLIQDALKDFQEAVHSPAFLHNPNEMSDEGTRSLKDRLRGMKSKSKECLMSKISHFSPEKISTLMRSLNMELEKATEAFLERKENQKKISVELMDNLKNFLCKDFKSSADLHMKKDPCIDLEMLKTFLQTTKERIFENFEMFWKPGDADFHEKERKDLEERLNMLQGEIEERQRQFLNERNLFDEMQISLLEKLEVFLFEGYNTWTETLSSTNYDLESLHTLLEDAKVEVIQNLEEHWNPGNLDFQNQQKQSLNDKLTLLQEKIESDRKTLLEEETNRFGEMEQGVFEKCEELKRFVGNSKLDYIPNAELHLKIEDIRGLVEEKEGFSLREFRDAHKILLERIAASRNGLFLVDEMILPKSAMEWAEKVVQQLQSCFSDNGFVDMDIEILDIDIKTFNFEVNGSEPEPVDQTLRMRENEAIGEPFDHDHQQDQKHQQDQNHQQGHNRKQDQDLSITQLMNTDSSRILTRAEKKRLAEKAIADGLSPIVSKNTPETQSTLEILLSPPSGTPKTRRGRGRENKVTSSPVQGPSSVGRKKKLSKKDAATPEQKAKDKDANKRKPKPFSANKLESAQNQNRAKNLAEEPHQNSSSTTAESPESSKTNQDSRSGAQDGIAEGRQMEDIPQKAHQRQSNPKEDGEPSKEETYSISSADDTTSSLALPQGHSSASGPEGDLEEDCTLIFRLTETTIYTSACIGNNVENLCLNEHSTDLVVGIGEKGQFLFGSKAALKCRENCWWLADLMDSNFQFNEASWMAKSTLTLKVGDDTDAEITAEFLLDYLLKWLKNQAEKALNKKCNSAIVTMPAWFCNAREATIRSVVEGAGFHLISPAIVSMGAVRPSRGDSESPRKRVRKN